MNDQLYRIVILLLVFSGMTSKIIAQESNDGDDLNKKAVDAEVQANNPLASIKTFNFHNYYVPSLSGLPDASSNTMWFRYAQPVGRFLVRASLPVSTVPSSDNSDISGLGDLNAFATYLAVKNTKTTLGIGPLIAAPTASNEALGAGKWQAGAALIVFHVVSPQLQLGG